MTTNVKERQNFEECAEVLLNQAKRWDKRLAIAVVKINVLSEEQVLSTIDDALFDVLAKQLMRHLRASDVVGFEESKFLLALADTKTQDDLLTVISKIVDFVSGDAQLGPKKFHISLHIGVSFYPKDSDGVPQLITLADEAIGTLDKVSAQHNRVVFF